MGGLRFAGAVEGVGVGGGVGVEGRGGGRQVDVGGRRGGREGLEVEDCAA